MEIPVKYQSCKMYRYTGELSSQTIKKKLKNKTEITKLIRNKNIKDSEKIKTVVADLSNFAEEQNGIIFDIIEHKQIKSLEHNPHDFVNVDESHKIYISGEDKILIIFGSIVVETIPHIIFDIIHNDTDEYYFTEISFEPKIIDDLIHRIIGNNKVKLLDPRFVFADKKFDNELKYAKFSVGINACSTNAQMYKDGINICTTLEPIFQITKCEGLVDDEYERPKMLYFSNHGKFWFRGVNTHYTKWLNFFHHHCKDIINTNNNEDMEN